MKLPRTFAGVWALISCGVLVLGSATVVIIAAVSGGGVGLLRQRMESIGVTGLALGFLFITSMLAGAVHWQSQHDDQRTN